MADLRAVREERPWEREERRYYTVGRRLREGRHAGGGMKNPGRAHSDLQAKQRGA